MANIIISETNKVRIENMIKEVEGKARERKITYDDMVKYIEIIKKIYGIPLKYLEGSSWWVDVHAQRFPSAYNGIPMSTHFKIGYENGKFRLMAVARDRTEVYRIHSANLSDTTKEKLIDRFTHNIYE